MARLWQWQFTLDGWQGAPGVNTFFTTVGIGVAVEDQIQNTAGLFQSAYADMIDFFSEGISISCPEVVPEIDVATGQIQEAHSVPMVWSESSGTGGDAMSRATMGKLQFRTDLWRDGRQVRGGVFLGPVGTNAIDSTGLITGLFRSAAGDAFNGLTDVLSPNDARLAVYSRPRQAGPGVTQRDGALAHVTDVSLWNKPAVLRSRRD